MNIDLLVSAFWVRVIEDLQRGHEETRLWLDTGTEVGGFLWWCCLGEKDPQWWRTRLLRAWTPGSGKEGPSPRHPGQNPPGGAGNSS